MQVETGASDYRSIIKQHLEDRSKQNPNYSLRAFARDLQISPSRLCEVLSGKQGLSRPVAERIAGKLGLTHDETEHFCDLVESLHARSKKDREIANIRLKQHSLDRDKHQVQLDAFKIIADWYHLGILELVQIKGCKDEPRWIAKKLGITEVQAELAIERLCRIGLLKITKTKLTLVHSSGEVPGGVSSQSIRQFHRQILEKALDALQFQPIDKRDFSSNVISIDQRNIPEALSEIRRFENRFCKKMNEDAGKRDGVYCLSIQFFNLLKE